jgi:hypothetical protein
MSFREVHYNPVALIGRIQTVSSTPIRVSMVFQLNWQCCSCRDKITMDTAIVCLVIYKMIVTKLKKNCDAMQVDDRIVSWAMLHRIQWTRWVFLSVHHRQFHALLPSRRLVTSNSNNKIMQTLSSWMTTINYPLVKLLLSIDPVANHRSYLLFKTLPI